jgi:hypothetical protein
MFVSQAEAHGQRREDTNLQGVGTGNLMTLLFLLIFLKCNGMGRIAISRIDLVRPIAGSSSIPCS